MHQKYRILVVEDDDVTRRALSVLLRQLGHHVAAHASTPDIIGEVEDVPYDVAILDVRLPGRWGDDFGRELKQRCPHTHVIFITGEPNIDRLVELVPESWALRKPVDAAALNQLITRL